MRSLASLHRSEGGATGCPKKKDLHPNLALPHGTTSKEKGNLSLTKVGVRDRHNKPSRGAPPSALRGPHQEGAAGDGNAVLIRDPAAEQEVSWEV